MKLEFNDLCIEVTRKCNMECKHCLRGKPQNISIDLSCIHKLFKITNYISSITFTGGEPTLAVSKMISILNIAINYNVEIANFYIVTNGKYLPPNFYYFIHKIYGYCTSNEISGVSLSKDSFHEVISEENIKRLKLFSCFSEKKLTGESYIINEGNAIEHRFPFTRNIDFKFKLDIEKLDEDRYLIHDMFYLNAYGKILSECDYSYNSQIKNSICSIDELEYYIKTHADLK